MARPRNSVPRYLHHKPSGQARVCVGNREVYLGVYNSPESLEAYRRLIAELAAAPIPDAVPGLKVTPAITVDEILLAFWKHAEQHYRRDDGSQTNEISEYRQTFKPLRSLYGHSPATEFGPLALRAVRQKMIDAGWCRRLVNARVGRVRRVFKWAASQELVPPAVFQALATVAGLQRGRSAAAESDPIEPAPPEYVRAALPKLRPHVRGMIELQLLTGMRPGEVCRIRPCDIDTSGDVWIYRPRQHKNAHREKSRVVFVGPKGRAVLERFTPPTPAEYYFSPRRAVDALHAERAANRKTPRYASHIARNANVRVADPKRKPSERYNASGYGHAVTRACKKAGVPNWHPNQLRHSHATEVRTLYGLEAAQVVLGHERADVTQVYAEKNLALAAKVAAEIG